MRKTTTSKSVSTPVPPPMRNGVSPSVVVIPSERADSGSANNGPRWATLLDYFTERFPRVDRSTWIHRMDAGDVVTANGTRSAPDDPCEPGLRLYYYRSIAEEFPIPFEAEILHHDDHLIVVDKPHFLPVIPAGRYVQETVLTRLKRTFNNHSISPIHRLDRETAGLVLFSTNPASRDAYQAQFRERTVRKRYIARASWSDAVAAQSSFPQHRSTRLERSDDYIHQIERLDGNAGPPNASTYIDLISVAEGVASFSLEPSTGQRHQLRVHMNAIGVPILGDRLYPHFVAREVTDYSRPLQLLAKSIELVDPFTAEPLHFESGRNLTSEES